MSEAYQLTKALGGTWYGSYGAAPCPVCQPERRKDKNALTISAENGRLLLNCKRSSCGFLDILRAAQVPPVRKAAAPIGPGRPFAKAGAAKAERNSAHALQIWNESRALWGTPAEAYLWSRAISVIGLESLRFNPSLWHAPTSDSFPALVARIEGSPSFAIHRTFLPFEGRSITPRKMVLGSMAGGHVPLVTRPGPLVIAEGIETALSLACGLLGCEATIWAALTAGNMRVLKLPEKAGHLILGTDGDKAGRDAGEVLADRARRSGWTVDLMPAPDGQDWNDVLMSRTKTRLCNPG